MQNLPQK